jgi:hypothetical protein
LEPARKKTKHGEEGYNKSIQARSRKQRIELGLTSKGKPRVLTNTEQWHVDGLGQLRAYDFGSIPRTLDSVRDFMHDTVKAFLGRLTHPLRIDYAKKLIPKFMDNSKTMHAYVFYHKTQSNIMGIAIYEVVHIPRFKRAGIHLELLGTVGGLAPRSLVFRTIISASRIQSSGIRPLPSKAWVRL